MLCKVFQTITEVVNAGVPRIDGKTNRCWIGCDARANRITGLRSRTRFDDEPFLRIRCCFAYIESYEEESYVRSSRACEQ